MDQTLSTLDLLRLLCGVWFLPHIIGKAMHYNKAAGTFEAAGFRPGRFFVGFTIALEIVAAAGMVLNIYPKYAALCGTVVMIGASFAIIRINGYNWRWQRMGPEYPIFWALVCILLALA